MRLVLVAVLAALLVAGCGDDDPYADYCKVVKEQQAGLGKAVDADGTAGLLPALPYFVKLEDAAPDDIAPDWSLLVERLGALADAVEAAGVDPADYDPTTLPDGVTQAQQDAIAAAATGLATQPVRAALEHVTQQALDVCGTELVQRNAS